MIFFKDLYKYFLVKSGMIFSFILQILINLDIRSIFGLYFVFHLLKIELAQEFLLINLIFIKMQGLDFLTFLL